jgi:hypothetical protein
MFKITPYLKSQSSCDGGSLVAVLIIAVISMMLIQSLAFSTRSALKSSARHVSKVSVLNIAEAGKERVIARIRERTLTFSANQNVAVYSNEAFGSGHYTVTCSTSLALDTVTIFSVGTQGIDTLKLKVVAYVQPDGNPNGWIKAAVTARTDVSTLGNFEIDGRNYRDNNSNYGALDTGGVWGVAAGGTVTAGGSSAIGGNITAPQKPALSGVTVNEFIDTSSYPQTPEEVLGLSPGALDAYKVSSCPAQVSGITYCETADNFVTGSGILIVHNSSGTASFGNYHGHFKGLIIVDEVKHINGGGASVLGAVFLLGRTVGGNCFGNGNSKVHYSSKVLADALSLTASSGRRTVNVVSWREVN